MPGRIVVAIGRSATWQAVLLAVLLTLVAAEVTEFSRGARAIGACDAAAASGDLTTAIARAGEAAEATALASPYPAQGFQRLAVLARDAEARHDTPTALRALRTMRAATETTRALGRDESSRRAEASAGLVRLATGDVSGSALAPLPVDADALRVTLAAEDRPTALQFSLLGFGALLLFGGAGITLEAGASLRMRGLAGAATAIGAVMVVASALR